MLDDLDSVGGEPGANFGARVDRGIVPMKTSSCGHHIQPLLLENHQEPLQGLQTIVGIESFASGHDVGID